MDSWLKLHPGTRVFVIWEPMLQTDWAAPGENVRARVSGAYLRQYWDENHQLSAALGGVAAWAELGKKVETGFRMKSAIWDAVLSYGPNATWDKGRPLAEFAGAPVFKTITNIGAN